MSDPEGDKGDQYKRHSRRGGKKAKKQKELAEKFERGEHVPRAFAAIHQSPSARPLSARQLVVGSSAISVPQVGLSSSFSSAPKFGSLGGSSSSVGHTFEPFEGGASASSFVGPEVVAESFVVPVSVVPPPNKLTTSTVPVPKTVGYPSASPPKGSQASNLGIFPKLGAVFKSASPPKGTSEPTSLEASSCGQSAIEVPVPVTFESEASSLSKSIAVCSAPEPKLPPKRLSEPVAPETNPPIVKTSTGTCTNPEIRVSLDFHNVLDCEYAGGPAPAGVGVRGSNQLAILEFLQQDQRHRIGVCSYIGEFGQKSQSRRAELRSNIQSLNRFLTLRGIPNHQLVSLCICSDQDKCRINSNVCAVHIDDKASVIRAVRGRGVSGVQFAQGFSHEWPVIQTTIADALQRVQSLVFPRVYSQPFY